MNGDVKKHIRERALSSFDYSENITDAALFKELDKVIDAGVNVVMCCHTQIRKFELPDEQGAYDRYELKLSKQVAPLVKAWCDIQLFANFKTYVIATDSKNHKGTGGMKRVMYASHTASWDAKNRHGLPDEIEFTFKSIAHLFNGNAEPKQPETTPIDKVRLKHRSRSTTKRSSPAG